MSGYVLGETHWPSGMTPSQREILRAALSRLSQRQELTGLLAPGSFAFGEMDEFSDLDLALAVAPSVRADVLRSTPLFAQQLGHRLVCFSGEHVGQPDLLICLYGPPAVNVDLKVTTVDDLQADIERRVLLWERGSELRERCPGGAGRPRPVEWQWIEDRFWHWVHYTGTRIGRGELFEAARILDVVRTRVLGPLALAEAGAHPHGVKKLEWLAPARALQMQRTVCGYDREEVATAMHSAATMYRSLRRGAPSELHVRSEAEAVATEYLADIAARKGKRVPERNALARRKP